ncbi:hypothetical protein [Edaphobacter bradus]|uniref:hypothetical protein n=1 Tax=Edaphobacter bradus TaxID=2259016 RepID=UPI0021DF57F9|nr:hypothetical protein [Edaphobacter bradus]
MRPLALALLTLTIPLAAQSNISNALLEETIIHSGTAGQFESAQKDYCAAVVKGGAPACLIFSTATFGQSDRYFTVLPFASFIHYDQGKYTDKGLTPEEAKALSARRVPPIASNHESAIALHRDLSTLPTASNAEYPTSYFTEYRLRPGTSAAFLKAVHDFMLPAARKANLIEFEVFTTTVGESPDRILIVTRLKNFAQLDQPDPIESNMSVGQRTAWHSVAKELTQHRDTWIMRYRADLSTDPRSPAAR